MFVRECLILICRPKPGLACRRDSGPNALTSPFMGAVLPAPEGKGTPRDYVSRLRLYVLVKMSTATETIEGLVQREYKYGFYTDVEADAAPPGLNEDIIRLISAKKNEPQFMLDWRLKAYRHWLTMKEPDWPHVHYPPIDYQKIIYYSAPKKRGDGPKSLDEVDPKLLETYEKLGIPLRERERLAGVAVDAVFDSVSVGTTFQATLAKQGIIF